MGKLSALKSALDMSKKARMQRAKDMGFDTDKVWYHGTNEDFDAFRNNWNGNFFTDDPDFASEFGNVGGYYLRSDRPASIDGQFRSWNEIDEIAGDKTLDELRAIARRPIYTPDVVAEAARKAGYDQVDINKIYEGESLTNQRVALNPSNIRSINAEFDPEKIDSPNLLASAAPAAVTAGLVGASMAPEEAQAAIAQQEQNQERRRRGEAFAMKREARKQQFAEVMQQLGNVLDLFDVPMQGLSGLARLGYGLAVGEDDALEQAARVTQQPIEDTAYQAGDYVLDKTGSPAAATAVNVLTQFAGPI